VISSFTVITIPDVEAQEYSEYTSDLFTLIEGGELSYHEIMPGVQPGDVVVWGDLCEQTDQYSFDSGWWATLPLWLIGERGAKMVMAWFGAPSITVFTEVVTKYIAQHYPEKQYGVDYVITEYIPGGEAAIARFASQLGDLNDVNGTTINSYPAFTDILTMDDVNYSYGTVCRTTDHDMFIRQFAAAYPEHSFILFGEYQVGGAYYGGLVKAVTHDPDEIIDLLYNTYGRVFGYPVAVTGGYYNVTEGTPILFNGSASYDPEGSIVSYHWDFGDNSSGEGMQPTHVYDLEAWYTVILTVTNDLGISDRARTVAIYHDADPIANFSATPVSGLLPLEAEFTDTSSSYDGIVAWLWDFGDGRNSSDQHVSHTYSSHGAYTITLTVYEADGDANSLVRSELIVVEQEFSLIGGPGWFDDVIIFMAIIAGIFVLYWKLRR
jgi:PKD repeat protein